MKFRWEKDTNAAICFVRILHMLSFQLYLTMLLFESNYINICVYTVYEGLIGFKNHTKKDNYNNKYSIIRIMKLQKYMNHLKKDLQLTVFIIMILMTVFKFVDISLYCPPVLFWSLKNTGGVRKRRFISKRVIRFSS